MVSTKCIIEPSLFTNIKGVVRVILLLRQVQNIEHLILVTLKTWTNGWTKFNSPLLINVFEKYSKVNFCKLISILKAFCVSIWEN